VVFLFGFGAYEGAVAPSIGFSNMSFCECIFTCLLLVCFYVAARVVSCLSYPPALLLGYTRVHAQQLEIFNFLFYPVIPGVMVSPFYLKALRLGVYSLVRLDVELEIERTGFGRECDLPA